MALDDLDRIPNNVGLAENRTLQRALEHWQPRFIEWWRTLGPTDFLDAETYLRTAISVGRDGWAQFGWVRTPDYRWGIFLAEAEPDRRIGFGDLMGAPVWQQVPGEHRTALRRLIVTQGDTEPASVEQQRRLGHSAPSLYDLRNLFQVNVEEGRHLWAMVYLLHAYFGRDGREEGEAMLARHAGDADRPRILSTFNEPIEDWLAFFMFAYFTDRDGKFQLKSLAESAFDPLSRTCQFMLTEEAHHMYVGDSGIGRVIRRTCEVMRELGSDDPGRVRDAGAVDLPTMQRYINFWFASSIDLFGAEVSSNAASYFANGVKGRPDEKRYQDHVCRDGTLVIDTPQGSEEVALRNAMNEVTRRAYVHDCENGIRRWNQIIAKAGQEFTLRVPSLRFRRSIGAWAGVCCDPEGAPLTDDAFQRRRDEWLPSDSDRGFIRSLMQRVTAPGKMAAWIAPPERGINALPVAYEYVRL
ncbi:MAG TPA: benzoyl-CoA 2,3-epoxidase subunit BoxB [Stellaceae bacterium]|nr:benzoyl-CoA 2,3-epoxidase subunit BoxB [Stellaceae bacterium]